MSPFHKLLLFYVCREHVLRAIKLLSSLDRMWVSCCYSFIVLGHISYFCWMLLLLSKPAWFCGYENLLSSVIINLQGFPYFFLYLQSPSNMCWVTSVMLTLCDPMDCSLLGSSVRRILQARILERIAIFSSRTSSRPRNRTCISCLLHWQADWILYH